MFKMPLLFAGGQKSPVEMDVVRGILCLLFLQRFIFSCFLSLSFRSRTHTAASVPADARKPLEEPFKVPRDGGM